MEGLWKKQNFRCSFSPSLLEERALSPVNIGIKYDILLHAFPQLHHFLRDIWYSVYPHAPAAIINHKVGMDKVLTEIVTR